MFVPTNLGSVLQNRVQANKRIGRLGIKVKVKKMPGRKLGSKLVIPDLISC